MKSKFCRNKFFSVVMIVSLMLFISACSHGDDPAPPFSTANQQRISKASYYDASDMLGGYNTYAYDGNNRLITDAYYDASSVQQGFTEYAYDGSGRLATASFYNELSELTGYAEYTYDGSGLMIEITIYDASGTLSYYN